MTKHISDQFSAFSEFAESIDTSALKSVKRCLELFEPVNSNMTEVISSLERSPTLTSLKYADQIHDSIQQMSKASEDARYAIKAMTPYLSDASATARLYLQNLTMNSTMTITEDYSKYFHGMQAVPSDIFSASDLFEQWQESFSSHMLSSSVHSELLSEIARNTDFLTSFELPSDQPRIIRLSEEFDSNSEEKESVLELPPSIGERLAEVRYIPFRLAQLIASDPNNLHQLTARQFEKFTAELLDSLGFNDVKLTPHSGDGGKDIIATRHVNGIPIILFVECKKYRENRKVGVDVARALIGSLDSGPESATLGVIATTSTFTAGAHNMIVGHSRLDGRDIDGLSKWIHEAQWPELFRAPHSFESE